MADNIELRFVELVSPLMWLIQDIWIDFLQRYCHYVAQKYKKIYLCNLYR